MFKQLLTQFWHEEDGAAAIEYGLMAALIAVVIVSAVKAVGTDLTAVFAAISGAI